MQRGEEANCFQIRNKNVLFLPFRNNIIEIDNYANCTVCRLILLGDACSGRERKYGTWENR